MKTRPSKSLHPYERARNKERKTIEVPGALARLRLVDALSKSARIEVPDAFSRMRLVSALLPFRSPPL